MVLMCPDCFAEPDLRRRLEEEDYEDPAEMCDFHPERPGISASVVGEIVDHVFRSNYGHGHYRSMYDDFAGEGLQETLYELVEPKSDAISEALARQLIEDDNYWPPDGDEAFYSDEITYTRQDTAGYKHSRLWRRFCDEILHGQRFFNLEAKTLVAQIFDGIHLQRDHHKNTPVYRLSPGEPEAALFRVRIVADRASYDAVCKDPVEHLGPPPPRKRRAGRMNPAGIATFYGAFDIDTCVAELRPTVGNRIVSAEFFLRRPIFVLDTTRFEAPIKESSLFNKEYIQRREQWQFMKSFMHEIAKPVSPGDEHLDYIPTQAVAEYLLHHHQFDNGSGKGRIEAVIYRSAQRPSGRNIVLLGNAGKVWSSPFRPEGAPRIDETDAGLSDAKADPNSPGLFLQRKTIRTHVVDGASFSAPETYDYGAFEVDSDENPF